MVGLMMAVMAGGWQEKHRGTRRSFRRQPRQFTIRRQLASHARGVNRRERREIFGQPRVTFGYPSTQGWGMMYFVSDPLAQQTRWRVLQGGVWKNTEQIAPFSAAYFTVASIVGWTGNLTNTWSGTLGELRVYKYALSSTDLGVLVQSLLTKWGI